MINVGKTIIDKVIRDLEGYEPEYNQRPKVITLKSNHIGNLTIKTIKGITVAQGDCNSITYASIPVERTNYYMRKRSSLFKHLNKILIWVWFGEKQ